MCSTDSSAGRQISNSAAFSGADYKPSQPTSTAHVYFAFPTTPKCCNRNHRKMYGTIVHY